MFGWLCWTTLTNAFLVTIRPRTHLPQVTQTIAVKESQATTDDLQKKNNCHETIRPSPLFSFFLADGSEIHGLLPSLQRRLDLGIPCYFEPNDPAVQQVLESLIHDTSREQQQQQQQQHRIVDSMDVCWALEACGGDVPQASIRIRLAQHYHNRHRQNNVYNGRPLEQMFRRHLEQRQGKKGPLSKTKSQKKRSPSAILVQLTVFLGLIRWICCVSTPQLG
jgi:hypothetical protein